MTHAHATCPICRIQAEKPPGTVEQWIDELLAAGWTQKSHTIWIAPNGAIYRGPFGAWKAMRAIGETR
jgi:hypothetical protein